ncbi:MAG TPA: hypothetical protein VM715_00650 [Candidatus Acidoferrum sp.]|nr:hypothetical protein [Candidatus Acidoferrum sp.]
MAAIKYDQVTKRLAVILSEEEIEATKNASIVINNDQEDIVTAESIDALIIQRLRDLEGKRDRLAEQAAEVQRQITLLNSRLPYKLELLPELTVIQFNHRFHQHGVIYTYVALKTNGMWHYTGPGIHRAIRSSNELAEFIGDQTVWVLSRRTALDVVISELRSDSKNPSANGVNDDDDDGYTRC